MELYYGNRSFSIYASLSSRTFCKRGSSFPYSFNWWPKLFIDIYVHIEIGTALVNSWTTGPIKKLISWNLLVSKATAQAKHHTCQLYLRKWSLLFRTLWLDVSKATYFILGISGHMITCHWRVIIHRLLDPGRNPKSWFVKDVTFFFFSLIFFLFVLFFVFSFFMF